MAALSRHSAHPATHQSPLLGSAVESPDFLTAVASNQHFAVTLGVNVDDYLAPVVLIWLDSASATVAGVGLYGFALFFSDDDHAACVVISIIIDHYFTPITFFKYG